MSFTAEAADGAGVGLETLLADLLAAVPAYGAVLYTPNEPLGSPDGIWRTVGVPAETLREYMTAFRDLDPWERAAWSAGPPPSGTVLDTDRLVAPEQLAGTAFHGDFLRRHDIARCLIAVVEDGRSGTLPRTRLLLIRGPSEPRFGLA